MGNGNVTVTRVDPQVRNEAKASLHPRPTTYPCYAPVQRARPRFRAPPARQPPVCGYPSQNQAKEEPRVSDHLGDARVRGR